MPTFFLLVSLLVVPETQPQTTMRDLLPSALHEWRVSEPARTYSGRQIFEYMDGAGEIYLAYEFQDLLVQRYARPGQEEILVEIFDMKSASNAFGVNTYMKGRGPEVPVGQEGEFKGGLLTFWRSRYFVCVRVENENTEANRVVLELGKVIAEGIGEDGERPEILSYLPVQGYLPATLRYFTRHEILNSHFYVADANILHLGVRTEAVLVRLKHDKSYLVLVRYSGEAMADSSYESFCAGFMPDASVKGVVRTENRKWTLCARKGEFLALVFDAQTKNAAQDILTNLSRRLP